MEHSTAHDRMLWARPDDRLCLAGMGSAWTFSASGEDRFTQAEAAWRSVLDQAVGEPPAADQNEARVPQSASVAAGPVAFYGFAFAPATRGPGRQASGGPAPGWIGQPWTGYPDALIIVPRVTVICIADQSWLILSVMTDGLGRFRAEAYEQALACVTSAEGSGASVPGETPHGRAMCADTAEPSVHGGLRLVDEFPPAETWKGSVRATASAVRAGRLRKAVLARGIRVRARRLDPAAALRTLRADYPTCTLFALARDGRWFLGATPERLVRVRNGAAAVAAVAGTAPRGQTEEEDRRFGEMLLASPKDRIEHAIVVEALRGGLAGVCTTTDAEEVPRLLTVRNAHHLHTSLRLALRDRQTVLALTGRLHPTPAVGGVPLQEALRWIRRHEGWDRGWYAGPIGWVDRTGDGEAAVAIRSALVHNTEALLFAGCGIVANSDPDQEYAESDLKLRPVSSALAASADPEGRVSAPRREGT
jgi:isochorismate synthase